MKKKKATSKYLSLYAEQEALHISFPEKIYNYVIVIPIYDEVATCLEQIFKHIYEKNILIIVVVNAPDTIETYDHPINSLFIEALEKKAQKSSDLSKNIKLHQFNDFNDVLLVNKSTGPNKIPIKQGVGLARKIGCDIALKLIQKKRVILSWIFSTDADVILPQPYFSALDNIDFVYSAVVFDFIHITNNYELMKLQYYYDFKLRYYLSGINYAQTGYNYIPMGSTLVINAECYAAVRGFPKKNAGEDFYLLNKLAKISPIKYRNRNTVIAIESRFSQRVPFGTGPALIKLQNMMDKEVKYYHPLCFEVLKMWLDYIKNLYNEELVIKPPKNLNLNGLYELFKCNSVFKKRILQINSKDKWDKFIFQWFDAFKTLKAVHYIEKKYPPIEYLQLLKEPSFAKVSTLELLEFIKQND